MKWYKLSINLTRISDYLLVMSDDERVKLITLIKNHIQSARKKYSCNLCEIQRTHIHHLREHMKTVHEGKIFLQFLYL